jgi:transcriptional regulator with XRE-family HTH domain
MEPAIFRKWRKALRYTQPEAGKKLGVDRSTIQNWERGFTRVPRMVELACPQLTRKWKQSREFGPVNLVYADEPIWIMSDDPARAFFVRCERYLNNEFAIRQSLRLSESPDFTSPFIVDDEGEIVWTTPGLLDQIRRAKRKRRI